MKYIITPSLERMAILKTVSWLWNLNDIRALIADQFSSRNSFEQKLDKWQKIEDKVLEKVSDLQQPRCLKEKLGGVVRTVGLEILKWIEYYFKDNNFVLYLPSEFFLTLLGTIDKQKTAELLIKDETLSIERRYRHACMFCLEDYLPELWSKLPESSKHKFYKGDRLEQLNEHLFVIYFTYSLKGELAKIDSLYKAMFGSFDICLFKEAIHYSNIVATKYFYKKLAPTDRQLLLLSGAHEAADNLGFSSDIEVLCYLLSEMSPKQQQNLFTKNVYHTLSYMLLKLLDWPWQGFLIGTITLLHSFIPEFVYEDLLQKIVYKVIDGYKDCCYQEIFNEVCMQISDERRLKIVHTVCASEALLVNLFKIKDNQYTKLIVQDATPKFKNKFITGTNGISICCKLINVGEWNLLEIFIKDCITKDDLVKLKEKFHNIIRFYLSGLDKWSKFVCFLDDLVCNYDKRKPEEEMNSKSLKKLCYFHLKI